MDRVIKGSLISLLLCCIFPAYVIAAGPWKLVSSVEYDWRGDGIPYAVTLEIPEDWDSGGEYTKLTIRRNGKVLFTIEDEDGLTKHTIMTKQVRGMLPANRLADSAYLLFLPQSTDRSIPPALLLFGPDYASSPGSLHIIILGGGGIPKLVFSERHFSLSGYMDITGDGIPELIGKHCYAEVWGPADDPMSHTYNSYAPYQVFQFGKSPDETMNQNLRLSEKYNRQNYYGWTGPGCHEDHVVVMKPHGGTKPEIMQRDEAYKIYGK
ncbi:MAG: hypothetical protein HZB31_08720 [Nitrospirae bacterium]|nr:hypothetical protein [Nitrospirota bacterium]